MPRSMEIKSCDACGKAKRKCGKQVPHCIRCKTRGIECTYPPQKPSQFVLLDDDTESVEPENSIRTALQRITPPPSFHAGEFNSNGGELPEMASFLIDDWLATSWFDSLETWSARIPQWNRVPYSDSHCSDRFIAEIRRWLAQWIETGSNPFIHHWLYRTRFPRCIQDAYAALTCYLHKTAANNRIVLRMIEDRAKDLVAEYQNSSTNSSPETSNSSLDSLLHIARAQALLIYQTIGLYDGDIRLRHLSESHIPILNTWLKEMMDYTSYAPCLAGSFPCPSYEMSIVEPSYISPNNDFIWYSWIVAETVRRTWVVGNGIQVMFLALQEGGYSPCSGVVMFTTPCGVWEARSAVVWEKLCSEVHIGLMEMAEAERLFTEVSPDEVNEFTKVVLDFTFGREKMERWGVRVND